MSKKTTAQRIFLSQMKQQAIKEKLLKSLPANQNISPENFAAAFNLPTKALPPLECVSNEHNKCQTLWPVAGSSVIIRLDAETEIEGIVSGCGSAAEELRLSGLIGVLTQDGHFIEVPYPDENVTVIHNIDIVNSSSLEGLEHNIGMMPLSTNHINNDDSDILDVENILSSRSANSRLSSDGILRIGTSIGKNLSKNSLISDGNSSSFTAGSKGALIVDGDEEYDDDVVWVDGHESLNAKHKKRRRTGQPYDDADLGSSDESDEEEVHWQTPSDSADIDIEVGY